MRRMRMTTHKSLGRGLAAGDLRATLFDRNSDVASSLANAFREVAGVEVVEGDLLDLECDAIVSPANSSGTIDGGRSAYRSIVPGKAKAAVLSLIAGLL
jgi:hypothetical protein